MKSRNPLALSNVDVSSLRDPLVAGSWKGPLLFSDILFLVIIDNLLLHNCIIKRS